MWGCVCETLHSYLSASLLDNVSLGLYCPAMLRSSAGVLCGPVCRGLLCLARVLPRGMASPNVGAPCPTHRIPTRVVVARNAQRLRVTTRVVGMWVGFHTSVRAGRYWCQPALGGGNLVPRTCRSSPCIMWEGVVCPPWAVVSF